MKKKAQTQPYQYTLVLEDIQNKLNLILKAVEPIQKMLHRLDGPVRSRSVS